MALGAMANNPAVKVKIVPVGLYYFHPHKFRSRAVVEFGHAMDVDETLVELYKKGGKEKREAVGKLLDVIYDALKTVTIRAPDFETLQVCFQERGYLKRAQSGHINKCIGYPSREQIIRYSRATSQYRSSRGD